jgi:hypothetical protein
MKTSNIPKSAHFLTFAVGIVYFWFGIPKFFPGLSPAEELAGDTIAQLTFHLIPSDIAMPVLAFWETGVGLMLILNKLHTISIPLALLHISLTFTPLFLVPELVFTDNLLFLTLSGQYIAKNVIIVSVLVYLWKEYRLELRFPIFSHFSQKARS